MIGHQIKKPPHRVFKTCYTQIFPWIDKYTFELTPIKISQILFLISKIMPVIMEQLELFLRETISLSYHINFHTEVEDRSGFAIEW